MVTNTLLEPGGTKEDGNKESNEELKRGQGSN